MKLRGSVACASETGKFRNVESEYVECQKTRKRPRCAVRIVSSGRGDLNVSPRWIYVGLAPVPAGWHLPCADRSCHATDTLGHLTFQSHPRKWLRLVECISVECRAEAAPSNSMIRIETHRTKTHLTFRIAGKLCGASVRALEDCWKAARLSPPVVEEAVDLSDVTSIDKDGWSLLRRLHRDGVRFSAKGLAGQTLLDELTAGDEHTCKEEEKRR
jgi:hypothetical protein